MLLELIEIVSLGGVRVNRSPTLPQAASPGSTEAVEADAGGQVSARRRSLLGR